MYVIIDLQMIAEKIDIDDYILGAIYLYIDLMTLFVYILRALGKKKWLSYLRISIISMII